MRSKIVCILLVLMVCMLVLIIGPACEQKADVPTGSKTLKIGCIMPFTGPAAMYGNQTRQHMEIYATLLKEAGGVQIGDDTYQVELSFADDGMQVAPSAAAARKLIYDEGVASIVGYFGTGYSAVAPLTNADKIIFIARSGADVVVDPQRDKYVIIGSPMGQYTLNQVLVALEAHPEVKTICWTGPEGAKEAIGVSSDPVDRWFEANKGIKNIRVFFPPGTTNFIPYLLKMKEQGAQLIYNGSTLLDIALMGKQRYEMGFTVPLAYGSDNEIATLKSIAGINGIQGLIGNQCAPWELEKTKVAPRYLEMANKIRNKFQEVYGKPLPHAGSFTIGINQVGQYIEACQLAGTTDPDKVMTAFKSNVIDTFIGSYKLTGIKTLGMPISFGYPCAMAEIRGETSVHVGEYPLTDVDFWYDELVKYK